MSSNTDNQFESYSNREIADIVVSIENGKAEKTAGSLIAAGTATAVAATLAIGNMGTQVLAGIVQKTQEWGLDSIAMSNQGDIAVALAVGAYACVMAGMTTLMMKKDLKYNTDQQVDQYLERKTDITPESPVQEAWSRLRSYVQKNTGSEKSLAGIEPPKAKMPR